MISAEEARDLRPRTPTQLVLDAIEKVIRNTAMGGARRCDIKAVVPNWAAYAVGKSEPQVEEIVQVLKTAGYLVEIDPGGHHGVGRFWVSWED